MKKLVQINVVCNGSTGRIMCDIAKEANNNGFDSFCFYGRGMPNNEVNCIRIDNKFSIYFHVLLARLGFNGHGSYFATKKLVRRLRKINPDVIHLHNIHGYYVNLKVLFKYLKKEYAGKIIWTLHDCWAFTGHCSHFTVVKCNKWKQQCYDCPQLRFYPKEYFDTTSKEYTMKRKLFTKLNNLTIVTPSKWLKELIKESFLKEYNITVINNGINTNIFKPICDNGIYDKYQIPKDKKIILGVANIWNERKGLINFIALLKQLNDNFKIVLVGVIDKSKYKIPNEIICIDHTESAIELAKIYSLASVFYNPSYEETFSLVTAEAINCNLPVIVFDSSATKELIDKNSYLVKNALNKSTDEISKEVFWYINSCKSFISNTDKFSEKVMINKYLKLYE